MADQLYDSHFLPPKYKRNTILQSGNTPVKHGFHGLVPDAGISFFDPRNTFLVLEVAYSQKEEDAQRKAQRYILDTDGKIKFVVLVIVTKKPRGKGNVSEPSSSASTSQPSEQDNLSPDYDTVHVHVYKAVRQPPNTLTGEHPINGLKIFPGPTPKDTFKITWADINSDSWAKFRDGARLPPEAPEPACDINFFTLASIARRLAGQAGDSREGTPLYRPEYTAQVSTPILKRKFVSSSSPPVHLSSGGTVSSGRERTLDPDYQPSVGSNESCHSVDSS